MLKTTAYSKHRGTRIRTVSEATRQPLDAQVNSVAALAVLIRHGNRSLRSRSDSTEHVNSVAALAVLIRQKKLRGFFGVR